MVVPVRRDEARHRHALVQVRAVSGDRTERRDLLARFTDACPETAHLAYRIALL
ncbi:MULTISPECIES: hypothetical protein [Streptomyces]|uniref:hypothetical protein n=1 Tax=Streptomyces herbicida TaxID=3065675 RepID=UPI00292CB011|nr:hypothetical protein [Streptomyces sp. NEAU-HV9]